MSNTTMTAGSNVMLGRALIVTGGVAELRSSFLFRKAILNDVVIEVRALGLCRTDLAVVAGEISAKDPVIPGHEFSGIVVSIGENVTGFDIGDRVVVNPLLPCGRCEQCAKDLTDSCRSTQFVGVDVDGACADFVAIPATAVMRIPDATSFLVAAFAEPVAAALAVLKADIRPTQRGLIYGDNRIAQLTHRVLLSEGFNDVAVANAAQINDLPEDHFDFIVETLATTESLAQMVRLLRRRGRIVLKSRQHRPTSIVLREILPKEPIFEAVNYGSFADAIELLANRRVIVDDLAGNRYSLTDYELAFAEARYGEHRKTFIIPREG